MFRVQDLGFRAQGFGVSRTMSRAAVRQAGGGRAFSGTRPCSINTISDGHMERDILY